MQQLQDANLDPARSTARDLLDVIPPTIAFIREIAGRKCNQVLSLPQLRSLGFVGRNPNQTLSALACHLGLTASATSRLVEGLVKARLMTRQVAPDNRRRISLALTPAGQKLLKKTIDSTEVELAQRLEEFDESQKAVIRQAMDLLRKILPAGTPRPCDK